MNELTTLDPVMAQVAKNIQSREATQEESNIIDSAWVNAEGSIRVMAWLSRAGKTWKNLQSKNGETFKSFEQYGKERFGYEKSQLYRMADAYETQMRLGFSPIGEKEIPETHLRPLSQVPDDIKKQIWEQVNEEHEKLTAKMVEEAVAKYKADLELEKQRVQNWREQDKEKRDEIESLRTQMFNLREAKKPKTEICYVDNAGELTKELKQENKRLKEKLKEAQDAKIEAIKTTKENMANGLDKTYNDKVARETAQTRRVEILQEKLNKIEVQVLSVEKHKEALADYKEALIKQALALMVLDDFPPNQDQTAAWSKLLSDNQLMLDAQTLGNPETRSDHNVIAVAETGI